MRVSVWGEAELSSSMNQGGKAARDRPSECLG